MIYNDNLFVSVFFGSRHWDYSSITQVVGNITIYSEAVLDVPLLARVDGSVSVREGAELRAPTLKTIRNCLTVATGAVARVPTLERVGDLYLHPGVNLDAPALVRVDGWLNAYQGARADLPALRSAECVSVREGAAVRGPGGFAVRTAGDLRNFGRRLATAPHRRCVFAGRCVEHEANHSVEACR